MEPVGVLIRIAILILQLIALCIVCKGFIKYNGAYCKGIIAGIMVYYTIIPLVANIVCLFAGNTLYQEMTKKRVLAFALNVEPVRMIGTAALSIITTLFFVTAYTVSLRVPFGKIKFVDNKIRYIRTNWKKILFIIGDATLLIGGFCILYYTFSFGSIQRALRLAGNVRSFSASATKYISYFASLLIIPAGMVLISPWCFLLVLDKKISKWIVARVIISVVLSALFLFIKAGRAPLLIFFVSLIMPFMIKKFKHPWIILIIASVVCMPVIDILDAVFDNSSVAVEYRLTSYLGQFAYPYRTVNNVFEIVIKYGIRWGQDYVTSFLGMIPGLNFDSTWRIVSEFISGPDWKSAGSTPTDLITFHIMQFHLPGLLLAFPLGYICRLLDNSIQGIKNTCLQRDYGINAVFVYCCLNAFWFVSTADFESLVRNMFFFGISIIIICITTGKKREDMSCEAAQVPGGINE